MIHKVVFIVLKYLIGKNPYVFGLNFLLQRYRNFLGGKKGFVIGESRGQRKDRNIIQAYDYLYHFGDLDNKMFYRSCLRDTSLNLQPKDKKFAGLELADLFAHSAMRRCLSNRRSYLGIVEKRFATEMNALFYNKIYCRDSGKFYQWGEVFYPTTAHKNRRRR